jgi:hypothetical protein
VAEKLEVVEQNKYTAGRFFKANNLRKAAKIYQRINGWYNFGDATNNYLKEDTTDKQWIETNDKLQSLKLVCFSNLVVSKFKMGENVSVVGITDQMLEVDPKHAKALYFRGQS